MPQDDFLPVLPKKLVKIFHEEDGKIRPTARRLDVSPALLWKLIYQGTEPRDMTLRRKLFLKGKYRKQPPAWVKEATDNLARLEAEAGPQPIRTYDRNGKRVK